MREARLKAQEFIKIVKFFPNLIRHHLLQILIISKLFLEGSRLVLFSHHMWRPNYLMADHCLDKLTRNKKF